MTNTDCVYDLDLDTLEWKLLLKPKTNNEEDVNIPRAKYGHVCTTNSQIYNLNGF